MENLNIKSALNDITDVFSGADGGISYVRLKILLEELESKYNLGDTSVLPILQIVIKFHKLVKASDKF